MLQRAPNHLGVGLQDSIEQIKAGALRWQGGGRKPATNGKPAQANGKDQLHHHGGPKDRQGIGADAIEPAAEIEFSLRTRHTAKAHGQAQHQGHQQGRDAQLKAGWQGIAHDLSHGRGIPQ